jgi:hypothetical protein
MVSLDQETLQQSPTKLSSALRLQWRIVTTFHVVAGVTCRRGRIAPASR